MSGSRVRILSAAVPLLVMVSLSPALAADPPAAALAAAPDTTRFVLKPSITLSDVGLDTNILTTARDQKRDTTGNIKLELEPSLPFGRARLSGKLAARGAWFREYAEQRSLDSDDSMKLEVQPAALVDGKVFAGYRAFRSVGDDDSNGRGFAGSLDLGYTLVSRVRIGVEAERDFAHSFRLASPYYVFTRLNNTVTARIESWEIRAVAGRVWLDCGTSAP